MTDQAYGIRLAEHNEDCECTPDEEFECARCNMLVGWCMGAADDQPEICDACWCELNPEIVMQFAGWTWVDA